MSYTVEKEWDTQAGLKAVAVYCNTTEHRCGYVAVPAEHPMYGVRYDEKSPVSADTLSTIFEVHGGLTYSSGGDGYPIPGDHWWFGFDCCHAGDKTRFSPRGTVRTLEYVSAECERLAQQLVYFSKLVD